MGASDYITIFYQMMSGLGLFFTMSSRSNNKE